MALDPYSQTIGECPGELGSNIMQGEYLIVLKILNPFLRESMLDTGRPCNNTM